MQTFNNGQKSKEIQSNKVELHVSVITDRLMAFLDFYFFQNRVFHEVELY